LVGEALLAVAEWQLEKVVMEVVDPVVLVAEGMEPLHLQVLEPG
jgi:hypothetical protein